MTAEARQVCLDGLAHGKRYEVQVRAGLPSAVRREAAEDGGACRLRARPQSVGARDGPRLRAAQSRPAGHSAGDRQHRAGGRRGLSHRRPQPGADPAGRRLPAADLLLRAGHPEGAQRRARLHRAAGRRHPPQRGRDDRLPDRRGDPQAAARRLRAGGLCHHQEGRRELARQPGHAVVRRLRPRPDRHQRRRRRACLRALAGHRQLRRQRPGAPAGPQQRGAGHHQDRQPRLRPLRCRPEARRGRARAGRAGGRDAGRRLRLPRPVDGRLRPDRSRRQGPPGAGAHRRLRLYRPRRLSRRRGGAPDRADPRPHRQGVRRAGHGDLLAARRRRAFARCADRPGSRRPRHQPDARQLGHDRHLARQGAYRPEGQPDRADVVPGRGLRARAARAEAGGRHAVADAAGDRARSS